MVNPIRQTFLLADMGATRMCNRDIDKCVTAAMLFAGGNMSDAEGEMIVRAIERLHIGSMLLSAILGGRAVPFVMDGDVKYAKVPPGMEKPLSMLFADIDNDPDGGLDFYVDEDGEEGAAAT